MTDVKKEPQTVADFVSGLKREPIQGAAAAYFFPLFLGLLTGFVAGFAVVAC